MLFSRVVALVSSSALLCLVACKLEVEATPETCAAQVSAEGCEAVIPSEGDAAGRCQWTVQRKLLDGCTVDGEAREACVFFEGAAEACDGPACTEGAQTLWIDTNGWSIYRPAECSGTPVAPNDGPAFTACADDVGLCGCGCEAFDDGGTTGA